MYFCCLFFFLFFLLENIQQFPTIVYQTQFISKRKRLTPRQRIEGKKYIYIWSEITKGNRNQTNSVINKWRFNNYLPCHYSVINQLRILFLCVWWRNFLHKARNGNNMGGRRNEREKKKRKKKIYFHASQNNGDREIHIFNIHVTRIFMLMTSLWL